MTAVFYETIVYNDLLYSACAACFVTSNTLLCRMRSKKTFGSSTAMRSLCTLESTPCNKCYILDTLLQISWKNYESWRKMICGKKKKIYSSTFSIIAPIKLGLLADLREPAVFKISSISFSNKNQPRVADYNICSSNENSYAVPLFNVF